MIWGLVGDIICKACPGATDVLCPICKNNIVPRCGSIKIWHWAHRSAKDCDSWDEPESEWHIGWKNRFSKESQEVSIKKCVSKYCNDKKYQVSCPHIGCVDCEFQTHRADIRLKHGLVIELQNSPISPEDIEERENFYQNMIWVINGKTLGKGLEFKKCLDEEGKHRVISFRWKHPYKSFWVAKKEVYVDFDGFVFLLKKVYQNIPCGGYGLEIDEEDFMKVINNE